MFVSGKIEVRESNKGKSLFTKEEIKKDEKILEFEKKFQKNVTETSMQIDENLHQESKNLTALENFLNHSCEPNGYIDFKDLTFRALRNIKKGEELTFNYNTSDWDMGEGFDCKCGSKNCLHKIKGFKILTIIQKNKLEPLLSPFLKKKLKEKLSL